MTDIRNVFLDGRTGEKVIYHPVKCKCGHTITFLSKHKTVCTKCGSYVFPTKEEEFKFRLREKIIRSNYE